MKRILLLIFLILIFMLGIKAQVPYGLNSLPSARPTIFLDFDGQTVDNPYWRPFNGDSVVFCGPSQMTNGQMIRVFNQISEDYRPFNINITTDSSIYFAAPINRRTRVIFTPTYKWYGSAGGVAYVESFRWGLDVPCFVFDSLFNGNDKRVAEAGSHEAGHTLGLYHQSQYANIGTDSCRFVTEYFSGRGTGDVGWAPIMGNSYFRNLSLWHVGINSFGCNSFQNDISIIASSLNGVTMRPDDHGNSTSVASTVNIINGIFTIQGLINDSLDADLFRFDLKTPGRFTLKVKPYSPGLALSPQGNLSGVTNHSSNIDVELTLLRNNTVIGVYNPPTTLDASLDTLLNPDVYYIKVNNKPNINISNSGMLGSYTINGSFGGTVVVPVQYIELSGYADNNKHNLSWQIVSTDTIENIKIEISKDGSDFKTLANLEPGSKNYKYYPKSGFGLYYRLSVKTVRQSTYISKTVFITSLESYRILSATVSDEIIINSKYGYDWSIFDVSGKKISGGRIFKGINRIPVFNLSNGLYIIQMFNDEGGISERIIKL